MKFKTKKYSYADLFEEESSILVRCNLIESASKCISSIPEIKFIFSQSQLVYIQEFVTKESWRTLSAERKNKALQNFAIDLDEMLNLGLVHGDINYSNVIFNGDLLMLIDFEPCFKQFKNQKRILASGLSFRSKNDYNNKSITSETDKIAFYFFCEYHLNQGEKSGYNKEGFSARLNGSLEMRASEEELIKMKFTDILKLYSE